MFTTNINHTQNYPKQRETKLKTHGHSPKLTRNGRRLGSTTNNKEK